jgi:hypothetical protein
MDPRYEASRCCHPDPRAQILQLSVGESYEHEDFWQSICRAGFAHVFQNKYKDI